MASKLCKRSGVLVCAGRVRLDSFTHSFCRVDILLVVDAVFSVGECSRVEGVGRVCVCECPSLPAKNSFHCDST